MSEKNSEQSPDDLKKALDENLASMSDLIKSSKSGEYLKQCASTKEGRQMMRELLKAASKEEGEDGSKSESESESNSEEEEGNEKMSGEDFAGSESGGDSEAESESESEDEEEGKGKKKKSMKKSLHSAVSGSEEIIDAVPILKSFVDVLHGASEEIGALRKEVSELRKSQTQVLDMQKSFGGVLETSALLIKSATENIELVAETPETVKGQRVPEESVLTKSFRGEDGEPKSYPVSAIRNALLKSFESGEISSTAIGRWENARYNMAVLSQGEISIISRHLKGGE